MRLNKKIFIILYSATILLFIVYILFLSDSNLKKHKELNVQIENWKAKNNQTLNQVNSDYDLEKLQEDSQLREQFAREQLNMHREDEDVFIFVYE